METELEAGAIQVIGEAREGGNVGLFRSTGEVRSGLVEEILTKIPSGRLGTGDEIAAAAVYLSSDEAAYVTGQTLHVNGGMAMI